MNETGGVCGTYRRQKRCIQGLVERPEERISLGTGKRRLEDMTKVELKELRRGVDWIELAQDRNRWRAFVNVDMNNQVPKNTGNFLAS
jgi:hypothetical protein